MIRLDEPMWWMGLSAYSTVSILKHNRLTDEGPYFVERYGLHEPKGRQIKIEICSSRLQINIRQLDFAEMKL
jgi:hypothetical protein